MKYSFDINEDLLEALDDYHKKTMLMEKHVIEKNPCDFDLEAEINDDLVYKVPIYDMGSRRYAAFCSFTEAIVKKEKDVKGNGVYFKNHDIRFDFDYIYMFYLFRLCGSGINYKPKSGLFDTPLGTHGFGNFWVIDSILNGRYCHQGWLDDLRATIRPFTDNKGYLLPQFSFPGLKKGHLKKFILDYSVDFIADVYDYINKERRQIYQVTDFGNNWLNERGFKKQNFVLTAFAADVCEYYSSMVDPKSMVYAGTQATRCIKSIFPKIKKCSEFEYINDVLAFQADRYGLNPIDCEDSRNCDMVRYIKEYQSKHHIALNGKIVYNNSVLKDKWGDQKYYEYSKTI